MVRIPQVGEPPYNEPDKLIAKFPNQPISFKGFVPEKEYLLHIPPKYKDIPGYRLSGQPVKIKLFDALSRTKYQIYVILPSEDGKEPKLAFIYPRHTSMQLPNTDAND
jgi:hypothetical protein